MKKYSILLFFGLVGFSLAAQNRDTKIADKLFDSYEYVQAVKEYLSLVEKEKADTYVYKQLADSYYNMNNTIEAEKWYGQTVKLNPTAVTLYRYVQVLKSNAKYDESNVQMKIFAAMAPQDERSKEFHKNPDYLSELLKKETGFEVKKISINSGKSDFGAVLYKDKLYFASARNENNKIYGWNNEPYLDLYQAEYKETKGTFSAPVPISELNTDFHEGSLTMSPDGNTIYFSSESFKDKLFQKDNAKKLKYGQVNLYKAVKEKGKWSAITPLPFNSKSYSVGNPSLDREGKWLYFASNMPGSVGGTDLWKVAVNPDGSYGAPENLGKKINTVDDENFPFITDDGVLYFSSDRLAGFGGLDIFSVDLKKEDYPNNMGKPLNTEKDDFAFTFNKEKNIGFVSSDRSGEDNIYSVESVSQSRIIATVKNARTKELLADARVAVLDSKNSVLDTKTSNEKGQVSYDTERNKQYVLEVRKDGYMSKSINVDVIKNGVVAVEIVLEPIDVIVTENEIILNPIYFRFDKSEVTSQGASELDKLVYVMSQNNNLQIFIKSHTDSRGRDQYNLKLSNKRAKATVDYIISKGISVERISGKGFGESEPKVNCGDECTNIDHATNRRSEFIIVKK
jgi:outer membrane protein OmpA-like peptidoglycan-associated protein/tetratricopeptide (TPR) repeat protein